MKNLIIGIGLILLGIICWTAYNIKGSIVNADGTLVEQFWLIPTGYILITIGITFIILWLFINYKK